MEEYVNALKKELIEKEELLTLLDQASLFYESQRGEAKVVATVSLSFSHHLHPRLVSLYLWFVVNPASLCRHTETLEGGSKLKKRN